MEYIFNPVVTGIRIKERREKLGYSQDQLAELIGRSGRQVIIRWEKGGLKQSDFNIFIDMCNALECDINYLLGCFDMPTNLMQEIHNKTGLSEKSIEYLMHINEDAAFCGGAEILDMIIALQDDSADASIPGTFFVERPNYSDRPFIEVIHRLAEYKRASARHLESQKDGFIDVGNGTFAYFPTGDDDSSLNTERSLDEQRRVRAYEIDKAVNNFISLAIEQIDNNIREQIKIPPLAESSKARPKTAKRKKKD